MVNGHRVMRKMLLVALSAAAVLTVASPAGAKTFSLESVAVSGPGLTEPLMIGRLEFQGDASESPTDVLWERLFSDYGPTMRIASSLGPKYRIEYRLDPLLPGESVVLRQDLFPYADGGPLAFTPSDQKWLPAPGAAGTLPSRWMAYPTDLITTLQRHGLPDAPTAGVNWGGLERRDRGTGEEVPSITTTAFPPTDSMVWFVLPLVVIGAGAIWFRWKLTR